MEKITHKVEFCVVGGGLAGMCAAIAAARRGVKTLLMHERPVLGGNASSEIRMWVCGAQGENNLETGLIEEIRLENAYRNKYFNYSIWDSVLFEKAHFQENLSLLLNCSCNKLEMDKNRIKSVSGWQMTTQLWHTVEAELFADCSGDSILAPLSGAKFRLGREAKGEFGESIAPENSDSHTMGMSCLLQARETGGAKEFIPPQWANKYENDACFPNRAHDLHSKQNFWWLELGGEDDSILDSENLRDELLKVAFGVWDHIKNHGDHGAENWELEWVGFLPGKRESRRYEGKYILTQNDVEAGGRFDDLVAYGGWSMDDHHPGGLNYPGAPTIFHPAPSPYGIPYRSLFSKNIDNLFFAGRNISATHSAMSSTRVMATCATLGQAVGTAASLAISEKLLPKDICSDKINKLKQALMDDDCYLPWNNRAVPAISSQAKLSASCGNPEMLRNGIDRPVGKETNRWRAGGGDYAQYDFTTPQKLSECRIAFDSDLNRPHLNSRSLYRLDMPPAEVPQTLVSEFHLEVSGSDGEFFEIARVTNNYQRLVIIPLDIKTTAIKLVIDKAGSGDTANIFRWDIR